MGGRENGGVLGWRREREAARGGEKSEDGSDGSFEVLNIRVVGKEEVGDGEVVERGVTVTVWLFGPHDAFIITAFTYAYATY